MLRAAAPTNAGLRGAAGATSAPIEGIGGARLLVSDAVVALLLADEARYRAVAGLFGVPRKGSLLVTAVAAGTLAAAVHDKLRLGARPGVGDALVGAASLGELLHAIAGAPSRNTRFFGSLIGIALVGGLLAPVMRESAHGLGAAAKQLRASFGSRYGHILAAGRRAPSTARAAIGR